MTRRETRKYALGVLRARKNVHVVKKEAVDRMARLLNSGRPTFVTKFAEVQLNPNYYGTITITP